MRIPIFLKEKELPPGDSEGLKFLWATSPMELLLRCAGAHVSASLQIMSRRELIRSSRVAKATNTLAELGKGEIHSVRMQPFLQK